MNEELSHTEDMTIEDFLSGATAYEIADNTPSKGFLSSGKSLLEQW